MTLADWIGSAGVFILLLGFVLNIAKKISSNSVAYLLLNFFGAAVSGVASLLIPYWPFVLLEAVWCVVAIIGLINIMRVKK